MQWGRVVLPAMRSIVRRRREGAPPRYEGLDIPTRTVLLERLDSCYDFPAHPP